mgnify:FL=1
MPPRKTTDFGALFESLIEDLKIQVAASVDERLTEFEKRLARLERRLDQLDPNNAAERKKVERRSCLLCERPAVARGLCSAHYQQWRYRQRKGTLPKNVGAEPAVAKEGIPSTMLLPTKGEEISTDN